MQKKVLIIEDNQLLRELIHKKVKEKYTVVLAVDGETGLEAIKREKPDLVLLDILLPGMSGFDVLEKMKSDPEVSNIPVLILSNLSNQSDIDKGMQLGAVDYIIKSYMDSSEIMARVEKILG